MKKIEILLIGLIMILGLMLRNHNLTTWPRLGATFDEYAWTWQGINIIQTGVPMSWSPHPQYKDAKDVTYQKTHFKIVKPYLEHPPFFGLVAGSFAILNGVTDMYDVTIEKIRPLALILGMLSVLFVFVLVRDIYGTKQGLLAGLLYATVPTVAIGSRILQNENFFIPMWLLSLILINKFIKTKNPIFRNIAAIICGLLILSKIPWVAGAGSIFMILLFLKKYNDAFKFISIVVVFFLFYILYGFYFDPKLFTELWGLQLNRYDFTFTSIFAIFQKPYLVDRFLLDGWIYFGFISILFLFQDVKKNYIVIFAFISYFLIYLAGIPDEPSHGWYRFPFYPFIIISIALFLKEYFIKNWLLSFMFLVFVGTALLGTTWELAFGFSHFIFRAFIFGWGLILLPQFFPTDKTKKFGRYVGYFWIGIFILMNIWSILIYNEQ